MNKTKRIILISVAAALAAVGIVLAIVLPITLHRHDGETFTVTFESNGGTSVAAIKDVPYNSTITEPAAPSKQGYTFGGWYKDARLSSTWTFATDRVTSDVVLYARWNYVETEGMTMLPNGNEYTVVNIGNATDANLFIPETYNGLPVTVIADNAFANVTFLQTVFIPSGIKRIGQNAFLKCSNLTAVTFGADSQITAIEAHTFEDCVKLTNIVIPSTVKEIGERAFCACQGLVEIALPASLDKLGENVFSNCIGLERLSVDSRNTHFYSSVNGTPVNCIVEITTVHKLVVGCKTSQIPSSVKVIGRGAFYGCSTLTHIVIPSGVTTIEAYAFQGCKRLDGITIPYTVKEVGDYAFSTCENLAYAEFAQNADKEYGIEILGREAFSYSFVNTLSSVGFVLPASLKSIGCGLLCGTPFTYSMAIGWTVTSGHTASELQNNIIAEDTYDGLYSGPSINVTCKDGTTPIFRLTNKYDND